MSIQKIISEYPGEYCHSLELAYGSGMMSEGGSEAIEKMFSGIAMHNKKCLDIGSGLGGVAFYLAETYQSHVTGIEINPWMVEETQKRISEKIKSLVNFILYDGIAALPCATDSFDVVYSKGVLVHLENKKPLFDEIYRVLKPNGVLIIEDWLSPIPQKWGPLMQKFCEVDQLTLFPQSEEKYFKVLSQSCFRNILATDESQQYSLYNQKILLRLNQKDTADYFCKKYGETAFQDAVDAYQLVIDAIASDELLVKRLIAYK